MNIMSHTQYGNNTNSENTYYLLVRITEFIFVGTKLRTSKVNVHKTAATSKALV